MIISAVDKHVVASIEDRLNGWRETEKAAIDAEAALVPVGQAGSDPGFRDQALRAKQLREDADRQFAAICRAVRLDTPQ